MKLITAFDILVSFTGTSTRHHMKFSENYQQVLSAYRSGVENRHEIYVIKLGLLNNLINGD